MNILCIAQVEDRTNLDKQIAKQTVQPDHVYVHIDDNPGKTIDERRQHIANNHQFLMDEVADMNPKLVWQIEGDCDLPEDCLERLVQDYIKLAREDDNFGYVSGVQVGRHGLYALGAWNIAEDRQSFESVKHKLRGVQKVDATGFYCLLAPTNVWLSGKATWNGEPYGPDVNWGLSLSQNKYVDMDLHIGHIVKRGVIKPEHMSTCDVRYFKDSNGEWKYEQLD